MCLLYKIVLCLARNFCPICSTNLVHISLEAPLNCSNLGAQLSFKSNKGVYSQLEAVEVQEKIKHIFYYFFLNSKMFWLQNMNSQVWKIFGCMLKWTFLNQSCTFTNAWQVGRNKSCMNNEGWVNTSSQNILFVPIDIWT